MSHDQGADEPGRAAPGGGEDVTERSVLVLELDAGGAGEILAEEMRGPGLERPAILHHRLDGVSLVGTGKTLAGSLRPRDHGDAHVAFDHPAIDAQHGERL